jgi:rhodanese-related sulfurtransferase
MGHGGRHGRGGCQCGGKHEGAGQKPCANCPNAAKKAAAVPMHPALEALAEARDAGVALITASEVRTLMASAKPPVLVNVLPAESYATTHIEGSVNVPLTELASTAATTLPDKDAKIIVYCASYTCRASTKAAETLMKLGYTNVLDYKGGLKEWTTLGLPLAGAEKQTTEEAED